MLIKSDINLFRITVIILEERIIPRRNIYSLAVSVVDFGEGWGKRRVPYTFSRIYRTLGWYGFSEFSLGRLFFIIFVGTLSEKELAGRPLCFTQKTGTLNWVREIGPPCRGFESMVL